MSSMLPFYHDWEGEDWWPIDVDHGDHAQPIDVEFWRYCKDHPEAAMKGRDSELSDDEKKRFETQCMHVFCLGCLFGWLQTGRTTCPLCNTVLDECPIRDNAFEMMLADAIDEGWIEKSEKQRGTKVTGKRADAPLSLLMSFSPSQFLGFFEYEQDFMAGTEHPSPDGLSFRTPYVTYEEHVFLPSVLGHVRDIIPMDGRQVLMLRKPPGWPQLHDIFYASCLVADEVVATDRQLGPRVYLAREVADVFICWQERPIAVGDNVLCKVSL
ncbi:hypothetical protein C8R47DRAFT_1062795 [Mycena vitilis]|nr:hypothetical protein C8R47DRAFT_1062795 [Mycena vitilis]